MIGLKSKKGSWKLKCTLARLAGLKYSISKSQSVCEVTDLLMMVLR
jgi:hypothetical protein